MRREIFITSLVVISTVVFPAVALAGSPGHIPSVSDLLFPFINFTLYIVLMIKLLARPISEQLRMRRDNVESFIKRAAMQWDQARRQLLDVQRRFNNLDAELKDIAKRIENEGSKEAAQMVADAEFQAKTIIKRAEDSAIAEANALETEIRRDLADEVVRMASERLAKEIDSEIDLPLRQRALEGLSGIRN